MIDCIAGYHLNPWTCGIAKFNDILARNLEVPVVGIGTLELETYQRPLLSLKMSEFSPADAQALAEWVQARSGRFELFLHAFDGTPIEQRLMAAAARVYCGNRELSHTLALFNLASSGVCIPTRTIPTRTQRSALRLYAPHRDWMRLLLSRPPQISAQTCMSPQ